MKYGFDVQFKHDDDAILRLYGDGLVKEPLIEKYGDKVTKYRMVLKNDVSFDIHSVELEGDPKVLKKIINDLWCDDV